MSERTSPSTNGTSRERLIEDRHAVTEPTETGIHPPPLQMPGDERQVAQEISRIGVEGVPADPKVGPGSMFLGLGALFVAVLVIAALLAWRVGWGTGLIALGIGTLGLIFNPVVIAGLLRARDRQDIVDEHRVDHRAGKPG